VPIVLVEDNPADIRLTLEAVSAAGITGMEVVTDGDAAVAYLRQEPPYRGAPRQGLVLLDLKPPRVDGLHVSTAIKTDPDLHTIPVITGTTSSAPLDVELAHRVHANWYLVNPLTVAALAHTIDTISAFWLDTVTLPTTRGDPP